jgi:large subunit ribosomal protein L18
MNRLEKKQSRRLRRRVRVRTKVSGTALRPRLSVFRSNRFTYVQAIDDAQGQTLCAASNKAADGREIKNKAADIGKLGELIGAKLKEKGIAEVVFDRNGYRYHGVVKALAEGARKAGLKF